MTCAICDGNDGSTHSLREMMFGTRHEFEYWECSGCGCIQITSVPERLGDYYPEQYYSFAMDLKPVDRWLYRVYFRYPDLGGFLRHARRNPYFADQKFQAVAQAKLKPGARILDVGCGAGQLVTVLRSVGFDAHGIDAFAKDETEFIRRSRLQQESGGWDMIMFHHTLEHIQDNVSELCAAKAKLSPTGTCLVRIPVAAWAWKHYGKNWVQLDAPRHLMIHTLKSFELAAKQAGFEMANVVFDSTVFQFFGSELYEKGLALKGMEPERVGWTKEQSREFSARAEELNRQQLGDQASFYLRPQ
jgi:SAM-dependent methyltransferase